MTDAEAVTRFEAFVQHQQPAPVWMPVTPYDFESRKIAEGQHPQLILQHLIDCSDADVLDYGCGPSQILVRLLRQAVAANTGSEHVRVDGYDPQLPGSDFLLYPSKTFDLVICREVLEHCTLRELMRVVRDLVRLSAGLIYVTTRFAKQPDHILSVETEFEADPTHITCLTKPFLRTLFVLEGCKSRPDLESLMDWQHKGRCLVFEVP